MNTQDLIVEGDYLKYELIKDSQVVKDSHRTMNQDEGVDFILAKMLALPDGHTVLKEICFTKSEFDENECKLWIEQHGDTISAFGPEVFESPITLSKDENMLVELKELEAETLKTVENDELEAIHSLLHAMHFRERANMSTTDWDMGRIRTYHGTIVEAIKSKQMDHFHMSGLDEGTWLSKDVGAEDAGDVLTQPDIGEHQFRSVMTAAVQGHAHCTTIGPDGSGFTSAQKGHSHLVSGGRVQQEAGHTHALTQTICSVDQMKWLENTDAETIKSFVLKSLGIS